MEIVEIERGETRTVEFKKELPQDSSKWIKTVVAFANGAGGIGRRFKYVRLR